MVPELPRLLSYLAQDTLILYIIFHCRDRILEMAIPNDSQWYRSNSEESSSRLDYLRAIGPEARDSIKDDNVSALQECDCSA